MAFFPSVNGRDARLATLKLSSTPGDPSRAVLEGIARLCGQAEVARVNHATTVATNALLERTGGRVLFVTTEGFRDLLALGRGERRELYSLNPTRVLAPVSRDDCFEIPERIQADGSVLLPLENGNLKALLERMPRDCDAVSVCLLHASLNPSHETEICQFLTEHYPRIFNSHSMAPGLGEYERAMTTVLAAYLSPKVETYLNHLEQKIGVETLRVVHSAGGLLRCSEARQRPHRIALSGPAAGLRGALMVGLDCEETNLVTLDMGGTSTDVALLHDAELPYTWESNLADFPLRAPSLEIHTVGAGGGSVAFLDESKLLQVGPISAGSVPGPACYGRGGTGATVTDALCWNGFLPSTLGHECLPILKEHSGQVLEELIQQQELTTDEAADGILQIATAHLAAAVRKVTTGRGQNPAQFTLFAFGGAGPLLACQVADSLGMDKVLIPGNAGVLSAWGALCAPWEREWSHLLKPEERPFPDCWESHFVGLQQVAEHDITDTTDIQWQRFVSRRYRGQGETLVSSPEAPFHDLHQSRFGFSRTETEVETIELRLRAKRSPLKISESISEVGQQSELQGQHSVRWKGTVIEVPVWKGESPPQQACGPYLHFSGDSTTFVAPGWRVRQIGAHRLLERGDFS